MTRRKTPQEQRIRMYLAVTDAYRRHAKSTTQREQAAADLGMDIESFLGALAETRSMGFLHSHE